MTEQDQSPDAADAPGPEPVEGPDAQAPTGDDRGPEPVEGPESEPATVDGQGPELVEGPESQPEALIEAPPTRSPEELQSALEALLMIADEPVSETALAAALNTPTGAVTDALAELVRFYDETGRGFELRSVAGGWRYYTREQHAELLGSYVLQGQQAKLSQAALETLAVIAYLQPVSRSRVSAVRGVSVDGVMRTLLTRELIAEVGSDDSGASLFSTTDYFLERMGLQSLEDLPELAPYLPEATELEAELGQLAVVPDPSDSHAPEHEPDPEGPELVEGPDNEPDGEPTTEVPEPDRELG